MFMQFEEKGKVFAEVISKKAIDVHIQTVTHLICGKIHIRPDLRLKDELNQTEAFIAVTDARLYDLSGNMVYTSDFLAINRSQVIWLLQDSGFEPPESQA